MYLQVNGTLILKKLMMPILEKLADEDPWLLLEPTAGQGQSLVKKLDDLTNYFDALEWHPKVGVCLDTCHVFAAGHERGITLMPEH